MQPRLPAPSARTQDNRGKPIPTPYFKEQGHCTRHPSARFYRMPGRASRCAECQNESRRRAKARRKGESVALQNGKRSPTMALCHPDRKSIGYRLCRACYERWLRHRDAASLKKAQERDAKRYARNRDEILRKQRERYRREHGAVRAWYLKKYGLTPQQFMAIWQKQRKVCAICNKEPDHRPCVDHDHETGRVRGLLCRNCNLLLGKIEMAGMAAFRRVIAYLEHSNDAKS